MLKRVLSEGVTLYKDRLFPKRFQSSRALRYRAVIGIGGNIGDVARRFHRLLYALKRVKNLNVLQSSVLVKNPPFGYEKQDDFFNGVLEVETSMQPREFLDFLLRMEKRFGRKRSFANAPRTLDLDIIFFDERVVATPKLTIPHPHFAERVSVLVPLATLKR